MYLLNPFLSENTETSLISEITSEISVVSLSMYKHLRLFKLSLNASSIEYVLTVRVSG